MKPLQWLFLFASFIFLRTEINAQSNEKRVIVAFKPGTTQMYIDSMRKSVGGGNTNELGTLNILNSHLWGLPDTANIIDVIGSISGGGRTHVVQADQNTFVTAGLTENQKEIVCAPLTATPNIFDSVPLRNAVLNSYYFKGLLNPQCSPGYQSTLIAIIDGGIDPQYANLSNVRRRLYSAPLNNPCNLPYTLSGYDFANNRPFPTDSVGHGTFVASEIIQLLDQWNDYATKLMILKVIGANGKGSTWNVMRAIERAACAGAKIVNLSIAGISSPQPDSLNALKSFMQYCADNYNMIFIVGAGNSGLNFAVSSQSQTFPAGYNLPSMICVAADSSIFNLAPFSNYDTQNGSVHLAAPGIKIFGNTLNGNTTLATGSSFAAPIVTAIAAFYSSRRSTVAFDGIAVRNAVKQSTWSMDSDKPAYSKTAWHGLPWLNCRVIPISTPFASTTNLSTAPSESLNKNIFAVSPSPFSNALNIAFASDFEGEAQLMMSDMMGKSVLQYAITLQKGNNNFECLPDASLPQGVYIVSLNLNEQKFYQKVVK